MWICICNQVNEKMINEVIDQATSARDFYKLLDMDIRCGKCFTKMREMYIEFKETENDNTMRSDMQIE